MNWLEKTYQLEPMPAVSPSSPSSSMDMTSIIESLANGQLPIGMDEESVVQTLMSFKPDACEQMLSKMTGSFGQNTLLTQMHQRVCKSPMDVGQPEISEPTNEMTNNEIMQPNEMAMT
jgi:hypothetical protein